MAGRVGDQPWQECQARVRKPGCPPLALPTGELTGGAPVSPPANMQGSKSGPAAVPGRSWPRASVSDCGEDRGRRLGCSGQSPRVGRPRPSPRPYPSRFSSTVDTRLSPDGGAWIPVPALPRPRLCLHNRKPQTGSWCHMGDTHLRRHAPGPQVQTPRVGVCGEPGPKRQALAADPDSCSLRSPHTPRIELAGDLDPVGQPRLPPRATRPAQAPPSQARPTQPSFPRFLPRPLGPGPGGLHFPAKAGSAAPSPIPAGPAPAAPPSPAPALPRRPHLPRFQASPPPQATPRRGPGPAPRVRACVVAAGAVGSPAPTTGRSRDHGLSRPQRGPGSRPPPRLRPPRPGWRRRPSPGPAPGWAAARHALAARTPARIWAAEAVRDRGRGPGWGPGPSGRAPSPRAPLLWATASEK